MLAENGLLECEVEAPVAVQSLSLRVRNVNEALPVFSIPVRRIVQGKASIELDENQIAQIRGAAICEVKGATKSGQEFVSNPVALVQLYQLLRESPRTTAGAILGVRSKKQEKIWFLMWTALEACATLSNSSTIAASASSTASQPLTLCGATFGSRAILSNPTRRPIGWNFQSAGQRKICEKRSGNLCERHQWQKLYKHVRRGNLNGLPNFLDIFRTLNGLLFAYHGRIMDSAGPVIPFGFVTTGVMTNLELLIGPFEPSEDADYEGNGFIAAIRENVAGDMAVVRERLRDERVPQMLRAAVEAMIDVRGKARKMQSPDSVGDEAAAVGLPMDKGAGVGSADR